MHRVNELLAKFRPGKLPECGIFEDVSFEEYLSWPCLNASLVKSAAKSAAHFETALTEPVKPSDALRFGSFAHAGRLEPLAITQRYIVMPDLTEGILKSNGDVPDKPKATKEYKDRVAAWTAENSGKEIVEHEWFETLLAMNRRLLAHQRSVDWLNSRGPVEVAIVWDDVYSGIRCKARADKLDRDAKRCTDYKTTRDLADFARQIVLLGYDVQGAMYTDGLSTLTHQDWRFAIVAQEKTAPHLVNAAELSETNMVCGARLMREAIDRICTAVRTGDWDGYEDPMQWDRPAWATPDVELDVGGELVSVGEFEA